MLPHQTLNSLDNTRNSIVSFAVKLKESFCGPSIPQGMEPRYVLACYIIKRSSMKIVLIMPLW